MRAVDLMLETGSAFNSNRARSLLTMLGVVIGISAVISMTAIIGGVKAAIVGEMGLSQARLVNISCTYGGGLSMPVVKEMDEALDSYFDVVMARSFASADVSTPKEKASGSIYGVYPEYAEVMGYNMSQGHFFTHEEFDAGELVVVLDDQGVRKLFGDENAQVVGQTVHIGTADYRVVGVTQSTASNISADTISLYMPLTTCQQRILGTNEIGQVMGLAREDVNPEAAADAAKSWLIIRFMIPESEQEDALYVYTMKSVIDQLDAVMASFQALMTIVASVSLLVGGIGIMNMMLTNVTERIREIGLRKALGARRRDITRQFLLESVCLTLVGGVIGILLGYLMAYALASLAGAVLIGEGVLITPTIGLDSVLEVAGICVLIGIVFGYYPARRAAKLDPVESLHYQ